MVIRDADHMTSAGQARRAVEIFPRHASALAIQAQHHELVAADTTEWWQSHLLGDEQATARLVRPVDLAVGDVWRLR